MPLPGTAIFFFFQFLANNEEMLVGFNLFVNLNCLKKITWMENWGIYMSKCKEKGVLVLKRSFSFTLHASVFIFYFGTLPVQ